MNTLAVAPATQALLKADAVIVGRTSSVGKCTDLWACTISLADGEKVGLVRLSDAQALQARVLQLESALQTAEAVGIERAAKWVDIRRDAYVNQFGSYDPETGSTEFSTAGDEYVGELEDIAERIRGLIVPAAGGL